MIPYILLKKLLEGDGEVEIIEADPDFEIPRPPDEPVAPDAPTDKMEVAQDIEYYSRLFEEPFDIQQTPEDRIPATVHALVQEQGIDREGDFEYIGRQATEDDYNRSRKLGMDQLGLTGEYGDLSEQEKTEVNRIAYQERLQPGFNTGAAHGLLQREAGNAATAIDFLRRNPNFRTQALEATKGDRYDDVDFEVLSTIVERIAQLDEKVEPDDDIVVLVQEMSESGYYPYLDAMLSQANTAARKETIRPAYIALSATDQPTYEMVTQFQRSKEKPAKEQQEITTRMQNFANRYLEER